MIDDAGAAPAAAEPVSLNEAAAPPEPSARSAIDRAFAAIEEREKGEAGETAVKSTTGMEAGDKAADADKTAAAGKPQGSEAPQRFSTEAKAMWPTVPDEIKGEVNRTFRELESGLTQYQQVFEPLKPFYRLAETHETTVPEALARYTALDLALASQDPQQKLVAIAEVLDYAGISPKDYAALIASEPAGEPPAPAPTTDDMGALRHELSALKAAMGGVASTLRQSQQAEAGAMVNAFVKAHPRLEDSEFMSTVTRLISTRMADDLASACRMADRLMPATATTIPSPASNAASAGAAHTRKGSFSIAGAPVSGSNPAKRKPASSARESVDRAFAELGL